MAPWRRKSAAASGVREEDLALRPAFRRTLLVFAFGLCLLLLELGREIASGALTADSLSPSVVTEPERGGVSGGAAGAGAAVLFGAGAGESRAASEQCGRGNVFPHTELPGEVVRWGDGHEKASVEECCSACQADSGCNVWVYCSDRALCGEKIGACWLKHAASARVDAEALRGLAQQWTSGTFAPLSPPSPPAPPPSPPHFAVVTADGEFRIRLREKEAPLAAAFIRRLLAVAPECVGCRFYRAEPVPAHWGSLEWEDSWSGGRWGPPYALMQGSFLPTSGTGLPDKPEADSGEGAKVLIQRGMLAWAGGGGGPDGFVALAGHPEWGHGHTVWGEVVEEDMAVVDALMTRPLRVENWGSINATVFVEPVPFSLRALSLVI